MIYLDTHVVAWLYFDKKEKFSKEAIAAIERYDLFISPMVFLELEYLYEVKKTRVPSQKVVSVLENDLGMKICAHPFPLIVKAALKEIWTRDPFDRIIVAHARSRKAPLLSRDKAIGRHYSYAIW